MIHDPALIAEAVLRSSGFARVGITAATADLRRRAALEMARTIAAHLNAPELPDARQLSLPL